MGALDRAVLDAVGQQVFPPDVIEQIPTRAMAEVSRPALPAQPGRAAAALREVEAEFGRLTKALTARAHAPSVVASLCLRLECLAL